MMQSDKPNELKCLHKTVIEEYIDYLTFTFPNDEKSGSANECNFQVRNTVIRVRISEAVD
jgi:hypothetical protein